MRIRIPLENKDEHIIGEMTIRENGIFTGRFRPDSAITDVIGKLAEAGFVNALILTPKLIPAERADVTSRNAFENNEEKPEVTREEAVKLGDKVQALLPPQPEGKHYELVELTAGTAVVIQDDTPETEDEIVERMHKHDQFGRRIAGGGS